MASGIASNNFRRRVVAVTRLRHEIGFNNLVYSHNETVFRQFVKLQTSSSVSHRPPGPIIETDGAIPLSADQFRSTPSPSVRPTPEA